MPLMLSQRRYHQRVEDQRARSHFNFHSRQAPFFAASEVELDDASSRRAEYSHTNTDKKHLALPVWAISSLIVVEQPSIV